MQPPKSVIALAFLLAWSGTACSPSPAPEPEASAYPSTQAQEVPATPTEGPQLLRGPADPGRSTVIDGSWLAGADIPPALYFLPTAVTRCHWRVVDYASGKLIEEGQYTGPGPAAIWISDGDLFQSEGCLLWQGYPQLTGSRDSSTVPPASEGDQVSDGDWHVGSDIPAGRYRSDRSSFGPCAYRVDRLDDRDDESYESTGSVRSIPAYLHLTLAKGDHFTTRDCGIWTLLDEGSAS